METVDEESWGPRALLAIAVLAAVVTLARLFVAGLHAADALFLPMLVLAGILLVYRILLGPWSGRLARSAVRGGGKASLAAARATSRGAAKGLTGLAHSTRSVHALEVRRFRVLSVNGETAACVMYGRLTGDEVSHGDTVRAIGRRARDG